MIAAREPHYAAGMARGPRASIHCEKSSPIPAVTIGADGAAPYLSGIAPQQQLAEVGVRDTRALPTAREQASVYPGRISRP